MILMSVATCYSGAGGFLNTYNSLDNEFFMREFIENVMVAVEYVV